MAKVFISYSRKDIKFAKRLTGELKKSDLDFWIDWEGIPPTVDWWMEIEKGIPMAHKYLVPILSEYLPLNGDIIAIIKGVGKSIKPAIYGSK